MTKNITFSADDELIRQARIKAMENHQTLNEIFREWLRNYVKSNSHGDYISLMKKLAYAKPGRHFNRDEMNER